MSVNRGEFGSKLGFILAAAGSAVGLGNIWKYPFEVADGGGAAFVIMYLAFCFILCFPVMLTEIAIGRKTNRDAVGAFSALGFRNWSIVGKLGVISGILILSFYNVVAGWAFGYFVNMIVGNFDIGNQFGDFIKDWITIGGYAIVFMAMTALIVSRGIQDGIEKAAKFLMPSLFLIILFLVIYAITLPNSGAGLEFYLVPDFSKISFETVYGALGQAFFSLSLGMGALITYGSYVSKKDNIVSSAAYITLTDVAIAFIAGLMMFPLVAFINQGDMSNVQGGAGLIFVTLPGVFESLGPILGILIGGIFFLLLSFAALTSTVSLLEVPVAHIVDEYKVERRKAVYGMAALIFVVGIPSLLANGAVDFLSAKTFFGFDFMTFVEKVASDTFLPLGGTLITFFAAYIWKKENLHEEIAIGYDGYGNSFVKKYLDLAVTIICPTILSVIFLLTVLNIYFKISIF